MKRSALLLAGVLVVAASPAGTASAQRPRPYTIPGPVSIAATPNPTVFSTPVSITGRVDKARGRVTVTLQGRILPSAVFVNLASARTANNGRYRFSHRPPRNTYYRVVAAVTPPVTSGELLVPVRTLVGFRVSDTTPARGSRVRFSGIVRPRHNGRRGYLQRQSSSGRWVTVARTTLRALDAQSSRYRRTLRIRRSGTYRVRVLGHADHAMGISRSRTLTVH